MPPKRKAAGKSGQQTAQQQQQPQQRTEQQPQQRAQQQQPQQAPPPQPQQAPHGWKTIMFWLMGATIFLVLLVLLVLLVTAVLFFYAQHNAHKTQILTQEMLSQTIAQAINETQNSLRGNIFTDEQKEQLFNDVAPSILKLVLADGFNLVREGTGFIARNQTTGDLLIITANHVLDCHNTTASLSRLVFANCSDYIPSLQTPALFLQAIRNNSTRMLNATILAFSETADYCFLRLRTGAIYGPPLLPSFEIARGKKAFIVGYPSDGSSLSMTEGIISQVDAKLHRYHILSDGAAAPGNSGGPLLRKDGAFVGMVLSIDPTSHNYVNVLPYWKLTPLA